MRKSCPLCGSSAWPGGEAACPSCGRVPRPKRGMWSTWRNSKDQHAFRARMLREYGGRCGFVLDGERCPVTDPRQLAAHHGHGKGPDVLLCRAHHRMVDPHAR